MNIREYQNYQETKSHTSVGFPYNTYLCTIPLDFTQVMLHWHQEIELIVIKKGQGCVSVDFETRIVTAGDMVMILPGQLHSIAQNEGHTMEYENIIFSPQMFVSGKNDLCALEFILPLIQFDRPTLTFITPSVSGYSNLTDCIIQIDALCSAKAEGYQLAVKGYLFHFFFFLMHTKSNRDSASIIKTKSLHKLKLIIKYIETNYANPISVDEMASLTFYSKSHFMKFFKTHMGAGFIEYLNDYRLTISTKLLITTELSILEVATQTGFENLSYFNRIFKRKYAKTPGQYRKTAADQLLQNHTDR